jgi:hypothetical protein
MGRRTVEQTRSIDIRTLQRADYFCAPKDGSWIWRINGKVVGEARTGWDGERLTIRDQVIDIGRTPCRFGSYRLWFRCSCGQHVSTVYSPNGRPWACRHCYRLTYATRQATPRDRHLLRAQRIRQRLGGAHRAVVNAGGDAEQNHAILSAEFGRRLFHGLLPLPAFAESCYRSLARRFVAVRRPYNHA